MNLAPNITHVLLGQKLGSKRRYKLREEEKDNLVEDWWALIEDPSVQVVVASIAHNDLCIPSLHCGCNENIIH